MRRALRRTAAVAALAGALGLGLPAAAQAGPGRDRDPGIRAGGLTLVMRAVASFLMFWDKDGGRVVGGG